MIWLRHFLRHEVNMEMPSKQGFWCLEPCHCWLHKYWDTDCF